MPPAEFMCVRIFLLRKKRTCTIISCNFFEIHDIINEVNNIGILSNRNMID